MVIRDGEIIPDTTEINGLDSSMTMQYTLQCSSLGIPDSNSFITWARCNPITIRRYRNGVSFPLKHIKKGDRYMWGSEKERVNNGRTVCPTKREISVRPLVESRGEMTSVWPSPSSPWVLSQETSQSITNESHDAVSKPFPSGVKTNSRTRRHVHHA